MIFFYKEIEMEMPNLRTITIQKIEKTYPQQNNSKLKLL